MGRKEMTTTMIGWALHVQGVHRFVATVRRL